MKYVVTLNGKKFEVEVEKVGGAAKSLSRQSIARTERTVVAPTEAAPTPVATPTQVSSAPVASSAGGTEITCPMSGSIWEVKVNVGDTVKYGDTLIVLEAMKMENDIPATVDGTVAEIRVKKGDVVDTDAVLVVIK